MQRSRHKKHGPLGLLSALAFAALGTLALGAAAQAQTRYQVTVNTSALNTTSGGLDFQFNPGGNNAPAATVQITDFTTNATLLGASMPSGGGMGALPGVLTITNNPGINEVFQGVTFGTTLSFAVAFSGPALTPPAGTTVGSLFGFTLFDNSGNSLLSNNPDGSALDISVNPDGSLTPQPAPPGANGLTVTAAPVPEASTTVSLGLLLALGVGGQVLARRGRVRA